MFARTDSFGLGWAPLERCEGPIFQRLGKHKPIDEKIKETRWIRLLVGRRKAEANLKLVRTLKLRGCFKPIIKYTSD